MSWNRLHKTLKYHHHYHQLVVGKEGLVHHVDAAPVEKKKTRRLCICATAIRLSRGVGPSAVGVTAAGCAEEGVAGSVGRALVAGDDANNICLVASK